VAVIKRHFRPEGTTEVECISVVPLGRIGSLLTAIPTPKRWEQTPGAPGGSGQDAASRPWPDFTSRLRRIYGGQAVPASETVISYGPGER